MPVNVAVVGGGIMGSGIAQVAAMRGHAVALRDVGDAELERAEAAIDTSLARFVKSGKVSAEDAEAARGRIRLETDLRDAVGDAEVVVEAVPENLELKQGVLRDVVAAAPAEALIGTNTSQLSITRIGGALGDAAERLVGIHFFNPPVMMRLVELVRGAATSDETLARARAFAEGLEKDVVVCLKDSPGFITSRAYAAFRLECLRILEEGVATVEDIDKALKLGFNLPMGPFELSDFNGVDSYLYAITAMEEAYGERFQPTAGLRKMVAEGRLGRKTGHGFYRYDSEGNRLGDDV
jgi:3-hydroxybutyryl-CoA dehydrogenase